MFGKMGDMMGMMNQLKSAQKNIEKLKSELDHEFLTEFNSDESLKITVSVSGNIKDIDVLQPYENQQKLAEDVKVLLNDLLAQARAQYEEKLAESAKNNMPDLSGLMGK